MVALLVVLGACGDLPLFPKELTLSPARLTLEEGASATLTRTGGFPPYSYALDPQPDVGSFDEQTLEYTAPGAIAAGEDSLLVILRVTDYAGALATTEIMVFKLLSITPRQATVAREGTLELTIWGGVPPYSYEASAGTIVQTAEGPPATASYTAPGTVTAEDVITVEDDLGNTVEARVEIVAADSLIVNPKSASLAAGETQEFQVSGGSPPYSLRLATGGGSLDRDFADEPGSFVYTAPGGPGYTEVEVTDSSAPEQQTVMVTIYVDMALSLSPGQVEVRPGQQVVFSAVGGSTPYGWSLSGPGAIAWDPAEPFSAVYTAPASPGVAWVTVLDSAGQSRKAKVQIRRG